VPSPTTSMPEKDTKDIPNSTGQKGVRLGQKAFITQVNLWRSELGKWEPGGKRNHKMTTEGKGKARERVKT